VPTWSKRTFSPGSVSDWAVVQDSFEKHYMRLSPKTWTADKRAEMIGYGNSADARDMIAADETGAGAARAMRMAIRKAGIRPDEVDYINAHGTSTPYNDKLETLAIKRTFGDHAYKLAVSSTKSMTGHLLGGAGGLEAGITALAVHHQIAPPTINLDNRDEECDLDYVPHTSRSMPMRYALSNSFGFGGTNASLLFKKYEG